MNNTATAKLRRLRISPRKARMVADSIRTKSTAQAANILKFIPKRAAEPMEKLLHSAVANANGNGMKESELFIKKITVDEGPKLKRWRARSMGRANTILKRTSHITIVLEEKNTIKKKPITEVKKQKVDVEKLKSGKKK
ncbi:50S ribosomal protein L22 [Patescibacteria group bacterium]|nr:50S ribosomal protein L22 [Patescibacteria group bacterium]MBU4023519.1 50S ribosomal protein L22 [Patescibacteria group bacterium]MBU4078021.1 50S ribosomal protein L22 [Patescibacteria group bacterium]